MSLRTRDEGFAQVFGKNLSRCRERLGISQEDLGFLAGLHRTAVGQLERGERVARTDTLVRLCGSLEVAPETLLAGLRWRPTQITKGKLEIEPTRAIDPSESKEESNQLSRGEIEQAASSSESQQ